MDASNETTRLKDVSFETEQDKPRDVSFYKHPREKKLAEWICLFEGKLKMIKDNKQINLG